MDSKKPAYMTAISIGSFDDQPLSFQPRNVKTSSSMEDILFIADNDAVLICDISDLANGNIAILFTIKSSATFESDDWYDLAISDEILFIFSETANRIEEYDLSVISKPVKLRDYPVYDKQIGVQPGTYDYDAYNDLFFMTSNDTDSMDDNHQYF